MHIPVSIYISHHPSQVRQAKELAKHLKQLEYGHNISVISSDDFLPGSDIENEAYQNIQSARMILVLLSVDYLTGRRDELLKIENSNCLSNNCVVPVPLPNAMCDWESTFLGKLKPLPHNSDFEKTPFDDSGFWNEVYKGVKRMLNGERITKYKEITIQRVRANSNSFEHNQDSELKSYEPFILRLRPSEIEFEVEGDSMFPIHQSGTILIGRPINYDEINVGIRQPYIIKSRIQDPVLKFIKSIDNEKFVLASQHPSHPDFEMLRDDITSVFLPVLPNIRRIR